MSVLVVGAHEDPGVSVVRRLLDQGDEVRLIEHDERRAERWRKLGAHVARGTAADVDLVERAAQHVRTVVVMNDAMGSIGDIVQGATAARVDRVVVVGRQTSGIVTVLRASTLEWVVIRMPRGGLLRRPALASERVAEVIDAADDLAGPVHLELDLSDPGAWTALRLSPPR